MENIKCQCGKIVCQLKDNVIIIKCRHCKRYININTKGIDKIEFKTEKEAG